MLDSSLDSNDVTDVLYALELGQGLVKVSSSRYIGKVGSGLEVAFVRALFTPTFEQQNNLNDWGNPCMKQDPRQLSN